MFSLPHWPLRKWPPGSRWEKHFNTWTWTLEHFKCISMIFTKLPLPPFSLQKWLSDTAVKTLYPQSECHWVSPYSLPEWLSKTSGNVHSNMSESDCHSTSPLPPCSLQEWLHNTWGECKHLKWLSLNVTRSPLFITGVTTKDWAGM